MTDVRELAIHPSPGGRPQPLAFYGSTLYVGSRDEARLYGIDAATWTVVDDVALPGPPFGLVAHAGALHVVVSIGPDDDRYLYRYAPGTPFDATRRTELPDRTGSNLASDGTTPYLVQMSNRRIVTLEPDGTAGRAIALPGPIAGLCFHGGAFYGIAADDDFDRLEIVRLHLDAAVATLEPLAALSPDARALAYGAGGWWTNYRERDAIVSIAFD